MPTSSSEVMQSLNGHAEVDGDASKLVVLASSRSIIGADSITPATIVASAITGKIVAVFDELLPASSFPAGTTYKDVSPNVILPGLVDAHVHLNEPGRTEWEGFWTGTRAAAFGGVTTVVDMPLNAIPPTTTVAGMKEKVAAARGKCWVDVGFYGGIIPGNVAELKPLIKEGVRGFKGFLIDSGVEEFPAVDSADVRKVFEELANEPTTVMFHAEMLPPTQEPAAKTQPLGDLDVYQTFLDSRPSEFETCAIYEILSLAHIAPDLPLHIVHLSAIEAIPMIREARARGVKITTETCFHYLSLAAEKIQPGDTRHKCCPPIRSQTNQDGLWAELLNDPAETVIQTVVSDHSPCTPDLKLLPAHIPGSLQAKHESNGHANGKGHADTNSHTNGNGNANDGAKKASCCGGSQTSGDFFTAWGGVSSVGLGLPILWTEATQTRHLDEERMLLNIARWCSAATAAQVGLQHRKGGLRVGLDADMCVFDTDAEWNVAPDTMLFRNKCSPYEGKRLRGVVRETWLRGRKVFAGGFVVADGQTEAAPTGELLLEPRTSR